MRSPMASLGVSLLFGLVVGLGLLLTYRWVRARSAGIAAIVAAGLVLQAFFGLALFWISYLDVPLLGSLHTGDGFWEVAPDARYYVGRASQVTEDGLSSVYGGEASPTYVQLLAAWMRLFGTSPAIGLFLNMALYAMLCGFVVLVCRRPGEDRSDVPCALSLGSLTLSPLLLMHGTQPLKDNAYALLIAAACVGIWLVLPALSPSRALTRRSLTGALLGLGVLAGALALMAGIRAYYAFLVWCCLAAALGVMSLPWQIRRLWRTLPLAGGVLALTWLACVAGARTYTAAPSSIVSVITGGSGGEGGRLAAVNAAVSRIERARIGFERSGGSTNIVPEEQPQVTRTTVMRGRIGLVVDTVRPETSAELGVGRPDGAIVTRVLPDGPAAKAGFGPRDVIVAYNGTPVRTHSELIAMVGATSPGTTVPVLVERGRQQREVRVTVEEVEVALVGDAAPPTAADVSPRRMAVGLLTVFVPISLLESLSLVDVDVDGGRGLLFLSDIDTLFVDATIIGVLALLYARWDDARRRLSYICVVAALGCVAAVMLGYVITNYGTLFRLRAMVAVPFWMLALAAVPDRALQISSIVAPRPWQPPGGED